MSKGIWRDEKAEDTHEASPLVHQGISVSHLSQVLRPRNQCAYQKCSRREEKIEITLKKLSLYYETSQEAKSRKESNK